MTTKDCLIRFSRVLTKLGIKRKGPKRKDINQILSSFLIKFEKINEQ